MDREFKMIAAFMLFAIIMLGLVIPALMGGEKMHWGANGAVEVRCVDGYKFVIGNRGQVTQMLDGQGHGVECKE